MSRIDRVFAAFWVVVFVYNAVCSSVDLYDNRYDRATYHTVMWMFAVFMFQRIWDRRRSCA